MSTYTHEALLNNTIHMSMTCHFEINKFLPKGNNDVMQCVTSNKSLLFAPKQGNDKLSKCF